MHSFLNLLVFMGLFFLFYIPVLFIVSGIYNKKRKYNNLNITTGLIFRFFILPLAVIYTLARFVYLYDSSHISIKIMETILSIFTLSLLFNFINFFLFGKNNILTSSESIPKLGRDVIHFLLITFLSTTVISKIWEFDLTGLLTALGVSSLVLGLALQEPLGNLFNGIALLFAKPFTMGDWVSIGSETGKIVEINWRSVRIINRNNEMLIIPNNLISKEKIKNLSKPSKIHAELVKMNFSYTDDPDKIIEILAQTALKVPGILQRPTPIAFMISYDEYSITYGVRFFIKDYKDSLMIKGTIKAKLYNIVKENDLTIPLPLQEIKIQSNHHNSPSI